MEEAEPQNPKIMYFKTWKDPITGVFKQTTSLPWRTLAKKKLLNLDWERHDHHIYDKVVDWFAVIGKELANPQILAENIYNMDEQGSF